MGKLERADRVLESPAGKAVWKLAAALLGILATTLLALILASVDSANAIATQAQVTNYEQAQDIALVKSQQKMDEAKIAELKKETDATVASLQAMTVKLTETNDAVDELKRDVKRKVGG